MAGNYEAAARRIREEKDPRRRAFLRLGMKIALLDLKVAELEPDFDVDLLLRVLSVMFDNEPVIAAILRGSPEEYAWFADEEEG